MLLKGPHGLLVCFPSVESKNALSLDPLSTKGANTTLCAFSVINLGQGFRSLSGLHSPLSSTLKVLRLTWHTVVSPAHSPLCRGHEEMSPSLASSYNNRYMI